VNVHRYVLAILLVHAQNCSNKQLHVDVCFEFVVTLSAARLQDHGLYLATLHLPPPPYHSGMG
jgi:hypothetical protein